MAFYFPHRPTTCKSQAWKPSKLGNRKNQAGCRLVRGDILCLFGSEEIFRVSQPSPACSASVNRGQEPEKRDGVQDPSRGPRKDPWGPGFPALLLTRSLPEVGQLQRGCEQPLPKPVALLRRCGTGIYEPQEEPPQSNLRPEATSLAKLNLEGICARCHLSSSLSLPLLVL